MTYTRSHGLICQNWNKTHISWISNLALFPPQPFILLAYFQFWCIITKRKTFICCSHWIKGTKAVTLGTEIHYVMGEEHMDVGQGGSNSYSTAATIVPVTQVTALSWRCSKPWLIPSPGRWHPVESVSWGKPMPRHLSRPRLRKKDPGHRWGSSLQLLEPFRSPTRLCFPVSLYLYMASFLAPLCLLLSLLRTQVIGFKAHTKSSMISCWDP